MGQSEREPQTIAVEEELQPEQLKEFVAPPGDLTKSKSVRDSIEWGKFSIGSKTLGWCIFLMVVCILLSISQPENDLVKNGFEAFKLIVMTLLGYMFGSNNSK